MTLTDTCQRLRGTSNGPRFLTHYDKIFFTITLKQTLKNDSEGAASGIKKENVFKSYLELQDFGQQAGNANLQDIGSSLEIQNSAEESNASCPVVDENEQESIAISKSGDELSPHSGSTSSNGHRSLKSELEIQEVEKNASRKIEIASGSHSVTTDTEHNDEHVDKSVSNDELDKSQQPPALKDVRATSEVVEPQTETSNKGDQSHLGLGKTSAANDLHLDSAIIYSILISCLFTFIYLIICRI